MSRRTAARLAAPAAFLAGVTVAVLLVRAGLDEDAAAPATFQSVTVDVSRTPTRTTQPTVSRPPRQVFYKVQSGDTLDAIALEHDTSVERLLELNPGLDPTAMQIGQRIRVR